MVPSLARYAGATIATLVVLAIVLATFSLATPTDAALPDTSPLVVFTELRGTSSFVWAADPSSPARRRLLTSIDHREGYAPRVAPSPDGLLLAVALLPTDGGDLEADGDLAIYDLRTRDFRIVAQQINARGVPVWSGDGELIAAKRSSAEGPALVVYSFAAGAERPPVPDPSALDLFPAGWTVDNVTLYLAVSNSGGFDLKAAQGSAPTALSLITHLSDGPSRNFRLSPDGRRLAMLSFGPTGRGPALHITDMDSVTRPSLVPPQDIAQRPVLGAVWRPQQGGMSLGLALPATGIQALPPSSGLLPSPRLHVRDGGFDVPLAWSPDERFLAVRHLMGTDIQRLTGETLDILSEGGQRATVQAAGAVAFAGWLPARQP